jgi:hypothetical protein
LPLFNLFWNDLLKGKVSRYEDPVGRAMVEVIDEKITPGESHLDHHIYTFPDRHC